MPSTADERACQKGGSSVAPVSAVEVRVHRGRVLWGPFDDVMAADLDHVEQAIRHTLPDDYRDFLLVANGGTLPYAVRLPPEDAGGELLEFSALTRVGGAHGLAAAWSNFGNTGMAKHLPRGLLETAQDGGGSTLYIDLRDDTFGSVWAFVFGLPEWTGSNRSTMGGPVAPSWNAYLDMLTLDQGYAQEVWEEAQANPDDEWTEAVISWLDSGLPDWRTASWAVP